eukprot:708265-Alexandrium_andersonii.AAC.1
MATCPFTAARNAGASASPLGTATLRPRIPDLGPRMIRDRRSETGDQRSEVGDPRSDIGDPRAEVRDG